MSDKAIEAAATAVRKSLNAIGVGAGDVTCRVVAQAAIAAYEAAMWRPIEEMKRDSTFHLIEVEATDEAHNALEEEDVFVTIGCNGFDNDGIDDWKIAGWNWSHDCIAECRGVTPRRFRLIPAAPESEDTPND